MTDFFSAGMPPSNLAQNQVGNAREGWAAESEGAASARRPVRVYSLSVLYTDARATGERQPGFLGRPLSCTRLAGSRQPRRGNRRTALTKSKTRFGSIAVTRFSLCAGLPEEPEPGEAIAEIRPVAGAKIVAVASPQTSREGRATPRYAPSCNRRAHAGMGWEKGQSRTRSGSSVSALHAPAGVQELRRDGAWLLVLNASPMPKRDRIRS